MEYLIKNEAPIILDEFQFFPAQKKSQIIKELNSDIVLLTSEIESKYPELYKYLDETPIGFKNLSDKEITIDELQNYLESLDAQLFNYFDTHELNSMMYNFAF